MPTKIQKRQIADGAIDNSKIDAGAAIETTKLLDGANFLKKDGSIVMTGTQDYGNNKIINLQTPTANGDAANKSYVDQALAAKSDLFKSKASVRAASVANVLVSNPGTAIFDGVTLANGDRLLLKNQTLPAENGIYVFAGAGVPLVRATDADTWVELVSATVIVEEGTVNADAFWMCIANQGGTLGTTAVTFQQIPTSTGLSHLNFVDKEVPAGAINGVNLAYTLANTPIAGSEHVYLNGILQESGAGNDYTITGSAITFIVAILAGEKLRASYRK